MRRTPAATDSSLTNFQDADVADLVDMRAAAEFLGVEAARGAFVGMVTTRTLASGYFVAKKCQRSGSERVVDIGDVRFDLRVVANFVVHLLLDVAKFFGVDVCEMGKSKRRRSGALSERPCLTCVPRMFRSAA